jgi:hypothetical protein
MPPEFIYQVFISVLSAQVRAGSPGPYPTVRLVARRLVAARRLGRAGGGPGTVSGRLLRCQKPCRVPAGRPCGPLLTPEPRPARRAGIRGQAGGLPAPRRPAHPQPYPARAAGRPGRSTTGPGRSGTSPTPQRDPGRARVVGRCRGRVCMGGVTHAASLRVSYRGRVTACVCSSVTQRVTHGVTHCVTRWDARVSGERWSS